MKILGLMLAVFLLAAATVPDEPIALDKIQLVDQLGQSLTLGKFREGHVLVSFVFTRCPMPNMCPLTISLNKRLLGLWKEKNPGKRLHLVLVTLDPKHDIPKVLKQFAKQRSLDLQYFTLVTGTNENLDRLSESFNILSAPSGGTISHNVKTALLAPGLREVKQFKDNEWTPEDVIRVSSEDTRLSQPSQR